MQYKKVLVTVSGEESDAVAVATAVAIAHPFQGRVAALYARGESGVAAQFRYPTLGESFFGQIEDAVSTAKSLQEDNARALFDDQVKNAMALLGGSASAAAPGEWIASNTDMPDAIVLQGGIYDLLVVGAQSRKDPYVLESALFRSGRPVLIAPVKKPASLGQNIMIGWNRSAEAGKAVVNSISLLQRADRVTICAIKTLAKQGPTAEQCVDYLSAHDVQAEIRHLDPSGRSVGAVLLDEADRIKADIIVTGANYQSRLREMMPGGVTGYLLQNATGAILMSH